MDRAYWLSLARCHWKLGNRSGFSWALDNARRAVVRVDLIAARLAHTERVVGVEHRRAA